MRPSSLPSVRHKSWLAALVLGSLVSLLSGLALAADPDTLIEEGLAKRTAGDDEKALELFQKADAMRPSGRSRAQIALAEQALGMWVQSEIDLARALEQPSDPWIAKNGKVLEAALATIRKHLGSLEMRGTPAGAEILVDGKRTGFLPLDKPLRLEVGRRLVEVRALAHHPLSRTVEIESGQLARESVTLVPSLAGESGGAARAPAPVDLEPKREGPRSSARAPSPLGWVLFAAGGAGVAFGIASIFVANGHANEFNDDDLCNGFSNQPPRCTERASAARTWRTVAVASLAGGGALALSGTLVLVLAPSANGGGVAGVRGTFF